ncbi:MAG: hypothetical protein RIR17_1834 [Planctomycetota bacterium]|jgi:hypothetical protein
MFVKVSVISVLAVVKDLGSKEYQPRRREEKKKAAQEGPVARDYDCKG